jgi:2,3-diketo-5-methylthio-1-phosphopentane phosphatase
MKQLCIVSDFDGTITDRDGLYSFIETYAIGDWKKIEQDWAEGKISSKECLIEEFKLVPDLSEDLVAQFIETMKIDEYFKKFYDYITRQNIDFYIVSDGVDYFINKILQKYGLTDIKIISNHGEFRNGIFEWSFPNDNKHCINNAGTCKCAVLKELRKKYEKICYIGDGVSDYCAADKADLLYAKKRLLNYCKEKNIKYIEYSDFNDILKNFKLN